MGVSITCTNAKYDFDMGYGGFFNLRKNVAIALDKEFGELYATLSKCLVDEDFAKFDKKAEAMIAAKHLDDTHRDVLDFLFASDCDGKCGYRTCKKIADLLNKDYKRLFDKGFRYGAQQHDDYREFIIFLNDCYRYHKNMVWY